MRTDFERLFTDDRKWNGDAEIFEISIPMTKQRNLSHDPNEQKGCEAADKNYFNGVNWVPRHESTGFAGGRETTFADIDAMLDNFSLALRVAYEEVEVIQDADWTVVFVADEHRLLFFSIGFMFTVMKSLMDFA